MKTALTVASMAALWVMMGGALTPIDLLVGGAVGLLVVILLRRRARGGRSRIRLHRLPGFCLFYLWELVVSNVRVASLVLLRPDRLHPVVVAVDLTGMSLTNAVMLANLVSLTPGSLSVEFAQASMTLYVHGMHSDSAADLRDEVTALKDRVEGVLA